MLASNTYQMMFQAIKHLRLSIASACVAIVLSIAIACGISILKIKKHESIVM